MSKIEIPKSKLGPANADPKAVTGYGDVTWNQRLFANRILEGYSTAAAYREAYPNADPKHARQYGHRILKKPHVQRYIREKQQELAHYSAMTREEVIGHLQNIVMTSLNDIMEIDEETGESLHDLRKATRAQLACIQEMDPKVLTAHVIDEEGELTTVTRTLYKIKLKDDLKALQLLMKIQGLEAPKQHQHQHDVVISTLAERLEAARARDKQTSTIIEGEIDGSEDH